jgi:endonuclease/exonuclease/phosphatase (EEP) superfamily protein YafD
MRLMTANLLHHNGATAEALCDALDVVKPHILAVQELTARVSSALSDRFPHHLLAPRPDGPGIGMAADRPVIFEEVPMPHRSGMVATLQPGDWPEVAEPVEIVAVHLTNPIGGLPWTTTRARRGQVETIERRMATSAAVRQVLCGDLNATPMWPAYRRLRRHYQDGISEAEAHQGRRPARTWAPLRKGPRLLRIDHVLVSGLRVTTVETVRLDGSDHLAVVADLVDDR